MLYLKNRTPYEVAVFPHSTTDGRDHATALVKGTFSVPRGGAPSVAEVQQGIRHAAKHAGEPGASSILLDSDMWPPKPGTDVVLVGHARSASPTESLEVSLKVGPLAKTVRVVGDRAYYTHAGSLGVTPPRAFTEMPLVYERAFGGEDKSADDPADHAYEERNHVGVGFVAPKSKKRLDGERLPNLEDPRQPLQRPGERPPPACFGFIAPAWHPRVRFAGTYDERWRRERAPLLPLDFDPRYYQAAHPELVAPKHLRGGEPVSATHVLRGGADWSFSLPRRRVTVTTTIKRVESTLDARLDTVVLDPDHERIMLCWRASIPCGRDFLYIDRVVFEEAAA